MALSEPCRTCWDFTNGNIGLDAIHEWNIRKISYLVGGCWWYTYPSEKYEFVNWDQYQWIIWHIHTHTRYECSLWHHLTSKVDSKTSIIPRFIRWCHIPSLRLWLQKVDLTFKWNTLRPTGRAVANGCWIPNPRVKPSWKSNIYSVLWKTPAFRWCCQLSTSTFGISHNLHFLRKRWCSHIFPAPYAPCMVYLPTFALIITQM